MNPCTGAGPASTARTSVAAGGYRVSRYISAELDQDEAYCAALVAASHSRKGDRERVAQRRIVRDQQRGEIVQPRSRVHLVQRTTLIPFAVPGSLRESRRNVCRRRIDRGRENIAASRSP
jgi:hypothetical protein